MGFIDKIIDVTGDDEIEYFLREWWDEREVREYIDDSLRSKVRRDGISNHLDPVVEDTSTLPDLDDPPELPTIDDTVGSNGSKEDDGDESIVVRRYMDLSKFNSFLNSGIWFSRLDNFDDDYEGQISDETVRRRYDKMEYLEFEDDPPPYNIQDMDYAKDKIVRKQSYVSCWRYGGEESKIIWDAYLGERDGVAIETTLESLRDQIAQVDQDFLFGKINYKKYKGSTEPFARDYVDRVFYKRFAFDDEQELRILTRQEIDNYDVILDEGKNFHLDIEASTGFNVNIDINDLVDKVILPPGINNRGISQVVHIVEQHDIDAEIWKSIIDVPPRRTATVAVEGENRGEVTDDSLRRARIIDKSEYLG